MKGEGAALELRGLRKAFGEKTAVDGIDLRIERGTFFGLVGPNGAGKTTALSMAAAAGALDEVRAGTTLEAAFADLVGAGHEAGALSWFAS